MTDAQIPDSPAEPTNQITEQEAESSAIHMTAGAEIQPFFANVTSVADLVGQLKAPSSSIGGGGGTGLFVGIEDEAELEACKPLVPGTDSTLAGVDCVV